MATMRKNIAIGLLLMGTGLITIAYVVPRHRLTWIDDDGNKRADPATDIALAAAFIVLRR
jgi:hypothetical protein